MSRKNINNIRDNVFDKKIFLTNDFDNIHLLDDRFTKIVQSGHTTLLNATLSDINDSGNVNWLMPDTATTLSVVSTSAQDGVAGTGIITLLLQGLDQNFNPITDFIVMNGTTPVVSLDSYRALNFAVALSGGTPGSGAVGVITISASTGGQVFGKFLVNDTTCEVGRYTVSKGNQFLGYSVFLNGGKNSDITFDIEITIQGRLPIATGTAYLGGGFYEYQNMGAFLLNEGDTLKGRGFYNSGGSGVRYCSATFSGQLASTQAWASLKNN